MLPLDWIVPPAPPHTHRTGQRLADNPGRTDTVETALEWTAGGLEDRSHGSFDVVFDSPRRKRTINDPSASCTVYNGPRTFAPPPPPLTPQTTRAAVIAPTPHPNANLTPPSSKLLHRSIGAIDVREI